MIRKNPQRQTRIYTLWKQNLTIDQISATTSIPRSSVGYYVRKFNRRFGSRMQAPHTTSRHDELSDQEKKERAFNSCYNKFASQCFLWTVVRYFLKADKVVELYYFFKFGDLLRDIFKPLIFTPEERKHLIDVVIAYVHDTSPKKLLPMLCLLSEEKSHN